MYIQKQEQLTRPLDRHARRTDTDIAGHSRAHDLEADAGVPHADADLEVKPAAGGDRNVVKDKVKRCVVVAAARAPF